VGHVSRDLKQLALDLGVPVLAVAQLNRAAGDANEPRVHHLRESGDIEADADMILLMSRLEGGDTRLAIAKNRQGKCSELFLKFDNQSLRYECNLQWHSEFDNYSA
jgi:replicative DNA helicase